MLFQQRPIVCGVRINNIDVKISGGDRGTSRALAPLTWKISVYTHGFLC
jgi:hypothetical protein